MTLYSIYSRFNSPSNNVASYEYYCELTNSCNNFSTCTDVTQCSLLSFLVIICYYRVYTECKGIGIIFVVFSWRSLFTTCSSVHSYTVRLKWLRNIWRQLRKNSNVSSNAMLCYTMNDFIDHVWASSMTDAVTPYIRWGGNGQLLLP